MKILDFELLGRIDGLLGARMITSDAESIVYSVRNHSWLLLSMIELTKKGDLKPQKKYENQKKIRMMNFKFWEDLVEILGPRLLEFNSDQLISIVHSAAIPKVGKKTVTK